MRTGLAIDRLQAQVAVECGYDTTPDIDAHYEAAGVLVAQRMFCQDSFDGEAIFGGQPFNLYRATIGLFVGWILKHMDFCLLLLEKRPDLSLSNILTVIYTMEQLTGSVAAALETDPDMARHALQALTLTPDNYAFHCLNCRAGSAPLIQVGRSDVIRSIVGNLNSPFFFMLRELRRLYPTDWDRALDARESVFRAELYHLFPGTRFCRCQKRPGAECGSGLIHNRLQGLSYTRLAAVCLVSLDNIS